MWCLIALLVWSFDRVEPPYAVLVSPDGAEVDVELSRLPSGARPGDQLAGPEGPILPGRSERHAALAARFEALLAPEPPGGDEARAADEGDHAGDGLEDGPCARSSTLASSPAVGQGCPVSTRERRRTPDHYARRARQDGYAARSVYKLEEIDRRVSLLRPGQRVLDLGCAPGSWLQYAAQRVGPRGRVVGMDLRPLEVRLPANVSVLVGDVFAAEPESLVSSAEGRFDLVMSDMAPSTCGDRFTDHVRSVSLCRQALAVARSTLRPGGSFVCKVFEGEDAGLFAQEVAAEFDSLRRIKPKGTRSESVEFFVVAVGWRGVEHEPERLIAEGGSSGAGQAGDSNASKGAP